MKPIRYVSGDATSPDYGIIAHCCNNVGKWGKGFVLALSKKHPKAKNKYLSWYNFPPSLAINKFVVGNVQFVEVGSSLWVANIIGQDGIYPFDGILPIRYDAIKTGLEKVCNFSVENNNLPVHMPRIGCGLAGGTWDKMEPIIKKALCEKDVQVTIYDL